jgi:hypothetical protein
MSDQVSLALPSLARDYEIQNSALDSTKKTLRIHNVSLYIADKTDDECVPQIHIDCDDFRQFTSEFQMNDLRLQLSRIIYIRYGVDVDLHWQDMMWTGEPIESLGMFVGYEDSTENFVNSMWCETVGDIGKDPARDSERLKVLIEWYLLGGKRSDIDPMGHIRPTEPMRILEYCDKRIT